MPLPEREFLHAAIDAHADRIARYQRGELSPEEFRPVRLSYGLYYQLEHTSHLQRIKVTGGLLCAEQLDVIADVTERWGRGLLHVTTRQDIQLHWIPLDAVGEIYHRLQDVGISNRGACSDSVRNVTASPCAGTCLKEPFDVLPYALAVNDYFLFHPLNVTLPRKFKPAFSGCPDDEAQGVINDLGFYARRQDGRAGFRVVAGGGLGAVPHLAVPLRDFLPAEETLGYAEAVVRIQHRYGERKNRHKARLKFLVQRMGLERFRELVEAEFEKIAREQGEEIRADLARALAEYRLPEGRRPAGGDAERRGDEAYRQWLRTNTEAQRQPGYRRLTITLPIGDATVAQLRRVTELCRTYGNGTVRATNDQNFVLPFVAEGDLPEVYAVLEELRLAEPNALHLSDVTSCPGADYCSLAVTRSMGVAERIRRHFGARPEAVEALGKFRIKISGCPNSCGQHHIGDIGLTGMMVKDPSGRERPHCAILLGGRVGEVGGAVGYRLKGRYPDESVPRVIEALTTSYREERAAGEGFRDFVDRVGIARLQRLAESAAGVVH
jgi:sulfite reductase beta subunit-like hemoprotein